jgi:hypothetical protein
MKRPSLLPWLCASLVLTLGMNDRSHAAEAGPGSKQPETRDEEPIMLSPFEVSPASEHGYVSTAVLQGGRGRIDLADVAGQVAVFTKEFLDDIGATTADEAFLFSATTQTYFDNVDGNGDNRPASRNPSGSTADDDGMNSRGLGGLDRTRNFFRTTIETDAYNTERISLVSGANAVQFGLGGAAGTAESASARASLTRNRQRLRLRTDSYGSQRGVLDISHVLIKDKLAIRGIGLRENREYFLRPGYEENRRGFLTTTYHPFKGTVLRVEGEYAYRKDNRPSTPMVRDVGYMNWLANPLTYDNRAATAPAAGRPTAPRFELQDGTDRTFGFNTKTALFVWPQNSIPQFSGVQDVRNTVMVSATGAGASGRSQSLNVPGYPWNVNPLGYTRYSRRRSRNLTATIEQRLGRATFLELGYSWEFYRHHTSQLMGHNAYDVMVDINRFLPDGVTPNPLYGRAFVEGNSASGAGSWTDSRIVQYRATVAHELDLTRSAGWVRHLGRHRLGFFTSFDDTATYNLGRNRFMVLGQPSFLSPAAKNNPLSAERTFNMRFYLPPMGSTSDPYAYAVPDPSTYGDIMGVMNFTTPSGEPFQVTQFENPVGFVGAAPTAKHFQRGSAAASTSSSFFKNNLVVNIGVRHDIVRNSDFASFVPILTEKPPTAANPNGGGIAAYDDFRNEVPEDVWTPYRKATRANYGFVVRPPRIGNWVTFGYDYSRNASLNEVAIVRDVMGSEVEPAYGESHEYSVRLRLLENRLNVKFNYFNALNRNIALSDSNLRRNLIEFEQQLYENDPSYPINPLFDPELSPLPRDFRLPGDRNSKGSEVSLTYSPNRNWRMFWNLGRTDTKIDDISAEPWWNYLDARLVVWKNYQGDWSTAAYTADQTVESAWTSLIGNSLDNIQANLGNPGGNSQTWRSSLVATRMFTSGWLKGASASVNLRYRGPSLVGFPNYVDAKGKVRVDRDNPYKSDEFILTGLMANYRFKGFGDTSWRVQLNANNVFNTKRVYLTRTFSDGTPRNFGRQPGREFILSVTIEH